ncbi:multidrug ABC transporter permease [Bacillus sp. FJAT-25509]|uniref:ABC transporter ATP-binding protein n=1 Tax=Bacillus sp. FJAT-25509 TaxID=1712029 RepID=UPI0006FE2DAE|nr:ABC transporter ATP-binding protein [Bacillus sp. FJAT-25509]KQL40810.1 multidrug ABC transporter permease [Bacillus sp. FJAT-25509]
MREETNSNKKSDWRNFISLIKNANPPKWLFAIGVLLSVATTLVGLLLPLLTKKFVDGFSLASLSAGQIAVFVAVLVIQAISSAASIYLLSRVGNTVVANVRHRLWKKMIVLPIFYFDETQTGDNVSRVTNDTAILKGLITEHITNFLTGIISIIGSFILLLVLDWRMTLVTFSIIPVIALIFIPIGKQMSKLSKATQDETAKFTSLISQVFSEIRLVKVSNAESTEITNGNKGINNLLSFGIKEGKLHSLIGPIVSFVLMLILVVIIGYGGVRVSSGAITAGALVAYILYLFQIIFPVTQITHFFTELQKTKGATERMISILELEEEDYQVGKDEVDMNLPININKLHFAYKEEEMLTNLNFVIPPGKVTAIVGPSGSGKTTLFSLIERFYPPKNGEITIGNNPINSFNLESWRKQIGYVAQESPLIVGTIRDNICYGIKRDISDQELAYVSGMAYVDQFVNDLPEGFNTEVGERGIKLSGGQRQRIGIARALLRNPKLLMLDEATSNLDSRSELVVQNALSNLMKGRTTLIIAHRLSTVIDADQIVFLDKGKITGIGTHDELYSNHLMYREFADQQLRVNSAV